MTTQGDKDKRAQAVLNEHIEHVLSRAPESPNHAEEVLGLFCNDVESGIVPDRRILEYLAQCFRRILDDRHNGQRFADAIEAALNLKRGPGNRRPKGQDDRDRKDVEIAFDIARRRHYRKPRPSVGDTKLEVATLHRVPFKRVEIAWDRYGRVARNFIKYP